MWDQQKTRVLMLQLPHEHISNSEIDRRAQWRQHFVTQPPIQCPIWITWKRIAQQIPEQEKLRNWSFSWKYFVLLLLLFTCGKNWNLLIASGYETNAKPVPLLTTFDMSSIFILCAKLPKIPKIVIPAIKLVNVSNVVTINTSLNWDVLSDDDDEEDEEIKQ